MEMSMGMPIQFCFGARMGRTPLREQLRADHSTTRLFPALSLTPFMWVPVPLCWMQCRKAIYTHSSSFSSSLRPRGSPKIYLSATLTFHFLSYDEVRRELPPTLNHNMLNLKAVTPKQTVGCIFPLRKRRTGCQRKCCDCDSSDLLRWLDETVSTINIYFL